MRTILALTLLLISTPAAAHEGHVHGPNKVTIPTGDRELRSADEIREDRESQAYDSCVRAKKSVKVITVDATYSPEEVTQGRCPARAAIRATATIRF